LNNHYVRASINIITISVSEGYEIKSGLQPPNYMKNPQGPQVQSLVVASFLGYLYNLCKLRKICCITHAPLEKATNPEPLGGCNSPIVCPITEGGPGN
jgi:hypothetical protein